MTASLWRALTSPVCELSFQQRWGCAFWEAKGVIWYSTVSPECDINLKSAARSEEQSTDSTFPVSTVVLMKPRLVLRVRLPHLLEGGLGGLLQHHSFHYALLNEGLLHRPSWESLHYFSVNGDAHNTRTFPPTVYRCAPLFAVTDVSVTVSFPV